MRIIHASDFHLKSNDRSFYALDPFFKDLRKLNQEEKIDFIVFSGDLVDRGGSSFDSITDGFLDFQIKVIERANSELNISSDEFIISPGNHDIERDLDTKTIEDGLAHGLVDTEQTRYFQENTEGFDELKRIENYKKFEEYLYDDYPNINVNKFEALHKLEIANNEIAVLSLNTAWRCYDSDEDKGNIILGEKQIIDHIDSLEDADIKIAVMHHSYDELKGFEQKRIKTLLNKNFDLVLTGHVHIEDGFAFQDTFGSTIYSTASSNSEDNALPDADRDNGYSIIDINDSGTNISYRKYSSKKMKYVPNVDIGDDQGNIFFKVSSKESINEKQKIKKIINSINNIYGEDANKHLLSFKTDSIAPKDINSLFVMPRITSKINYNKKEDLDLTEKNEIEYNLTDLCNYTENIILTGQKEIGKTILLDKMFLELSSNFSKYSKIPILLNYEKLENKNFLQLISEFLHVPINELRNGILVTENILLMVDNLDFHPENPILKKIEKFLNDYPNVQLICTTTSLVEDSFQFHQLEYEFVKSATIMRIQSFRTKEIHELIQKWFGNRSISDYDYNVDLPIENVIDRFKQLNLPSTPMAVSMFLWILEKQDTYSPVNNAQMLENFLERLFHKNEQELILSSEFSYRNKEYLLTSIAFFMYSESNQEYSLDYETLRSFIIKYLEKKMFNYKVDDIFNEFLDLGIFIESKNESKRIIKFRFACFFQYYLMKNINLNTDFKNYILDDDNCLSFMDELDYYTGLNMNDDHLLKTIIEKMMSKYSSIKKNVVDNSPYSYDTFFETKKAITDLLTEERIENITEDIKQIPDSSEKVNDNILETADQKSDIIKSKTDPMNPLKMLESYWILAGTILRNSEEIENAQLKKDSLNNIIECSLVFASLTKLLLIKFLQETEENLNIRDENIISNFKFLSIFLPYVHQELLSQVIGTKKLSIALQEKFDSIIDDSSVTDFEKFIYTFLLFDLNEQNKYSYVERLIKNRKRNYSKDIISLKLINLFFDNTFSNQEEKTLKNLLADLRAKHPRQKGRIISDLEKKKMLQSAKKKTVNN